MTLRALHTRAPLRATSATHDSLATFLAHARRTNLDPTSTVYIGTHYEYTVAAALARLGFALARRGGASDKGIDLLGAWRLPGARAPLTAFVQCKALRRKADPRLVRELEGAHAALPAAAAESGVGSHDDEVRGEDVSHGSYGPAGPRRRRAVGFLATPLAATRGVREALARSRVPLGFASVSLDGRVLQMLWNRAAAETGELTGLEVGMRYVPGTAAEEEREADVAREVFLSWRGMPWEPDSSSSSSSSSSS